MGVGTSKSSGGKRPEVTVWSIDEREVAMLKEFHEQRDRLPGVILNNSIVTQLMRQSQ